jgi:hypothetical protein
MVAARRLCRGSATRGWINDLDLRLLARRRRDPVEQHDVIDHKRRGRRVSIVVDAGWQVSARTFSEIILTAALAFGFRE